MPDESKDSRLNPARLLQMIESLHEQYPMETAMAALNQLEKSSEADDKPKTNEPIQ